MFIWNKCTGLVKFSSYSPLYIWFTNPADFQIGNVRVDEALFNKLQKLAQENEVSTQTIVREILANFIDEVLIK